MNPTQSDYPAEELCRYLERPQAWAHTSQALQRIALAIVGDEGDAEDIVQGAWLELLKNPRRKLSQGWLKRLVRFRALDELRSKSRDPIRLEEEVSESQDTGTEEVRWKLEAQREVLDAVNSLKEPYLGTVVLRYFEGKGPSEIARELSVPERTIKTRLTRAHEMLRARLGARQQDSLGNWAPGLVAFSGINGLKASQFTVPKASALLMKKAILISVAVAAVLLVPFAIQSQRGGHEALTKSESVHQSTPAFHPAPDESPSPEAFREIVASAPQGAKQEQAKFEYAFPRKPDSEVGSLALQIRWSDGSPAGNLQIGIMQMDAVDAFLLSRSYRTDATGFVEIDQLAPGRVTVHTSNTDVEEATIFAAERTLLELQAHAGISLRGRVLTQQGDPVAGAYIFHTTGPGSDAQILPSSVSDGMGRYELRDLRTHSYVSARAATHSPSFQVQITGDPEHTIEQDLIVRDGACTLRGIAYSPTGLPVVDAKIRIEVNAPWGERPVMANPEQAVRPPLAFEVRTDAEGRFESKQVGAGQVRVQARTQSWRPWEQLVELRAGEPTEITIRFERGASVSGAVRDQNGDPVAKASVFTEQTVEFGAFRARTDSEGNFEFEGVPPGFMNFSTYIKGYAQDETELEVRLDSANELDVILGKLHTVSGVVVDESGAPLNRWLVAIDTPVGHWVTSAWTDENGKFELQGIPPGSTDLFVCTENFMQSGSGFDLESVLPSQGPLRIVVPDSAHPSSSVRMDLMVDGDPAPVETRVRLRSATPIRHREVYPKADDSLIMEGIASGRYFVEVSLPGYATLNHRFELDSGEDLDLGTLHLERGGRVHVVIEKAQSNGVGQVDALDSRGNSFHSIQVRDGEGFSGPFPTGAVTLRYSSGERATQFAEALIQEGETTVVRFVERPGVFRSVSFVRKDGKPLRFETIAHVTDAAGKVHYHTEDFQREFRSDGTTAIDLFGLEIGAYHILIQDPGGRSEVFWLNVGSPGEPLQQSEPFQLDW